MIIEHSKTAIAKDDHLLISHGYAEDQIAQIRILFEYTDEQKEENLRNLGCDGKDKDAYLREDYRMRGEYMYPIISRLAEEFPYDIEGYCQGKDAFVKQLEEKALLWRKLQENRRGLKFCRLRNCRKLLKPAAEWFAEKWGIAEEIYLESMERCLRQKEEIPQWYVLIDEEGNIAAGAGMIDNDFHSRKDLTPNLCALYVEERYRNRGLARWILDEIRAEAGNMGYDKLYLVTDHMGFYERCGWKFLTMAKDQEAMPIRLYEADTREIEKD